MLHIYILGQVYCVVQYYIFWLLCLLILSISKKIVWKSSTWLWTCLIFLVILSILSLYILRLCYYFSLNNQTMYYKVYFFVSSHFFCHKVCFVWFNKAMLVFLWLVFKCYVFFHSFSFCHFISLYFLHVFCKYMFFSYTLTLW